MGPKNTSRSDCNNSHKQHDSKNKMESKHEKGISKFENLAIEFSAKIKEETKKIQMEFLDRLKRMKEEILEESRKSKEAWDKERKCLNEELQRCRKKIEDLENRNGDPVHNIHDRLQELEAKDEKREQKEKRNNIVIIGANFEKNCKEKKSEVRKMIGNLLKIDVQVKTAYGVSKDKRGGDIIVAEIATYEEKDEIMKRKSLLKNAKEKIFINNWLTKKQRENIKREKRSNLEGDRQSDEASNTLDCGEEDETNKKINERLFMIWESINKGQAILNASKWTDKK